MLVGTFIENYVSLIISRVASSSAPYQMEPADSQTLVARYSDQPSYCVNRLHLSLLTFTRLKPITNRKVHLQGLITTV